MSDRDEDSLAGICQTSLTLSIEARALGMTVERQWAARHSHRGALPRRVETGSEDLRPKFLRRRDNSRR